jgi:hypothetical protein
MNGCPSEFGLERLRLGELTDTQASTDMLTHVAQCVTCTGRLAELGEPPPPLALDEVWAAAGGGRRRRAWGWAAVGLAAAAALVLLLRPARRTDHDLIKGGPWSLLVLVRGEGGRVAAVPSGARLSPGDQLRFEVLTTWARGYVALISLDSANAVTPLYPPGGGASPEIRGGRRVLLDGAVELDQTLGSERIELLGCRQPVAMATLIASARAALTRAGGDLQKVGELAPGCHRETFWIVKVKR